MATESSVVLVVSVKKSGTTVEGFRRHIQSVLPSNVVQTFQLMPRKGQRVSGRIILDSSLPNLATQAKTFALLLRQSTLHDQPVSAQVDPVLYFRAQQQPPGARTPSLASVAGTEEEDGRLNWKNSKTVARTFFAWLHQPDNGTHKESVDLTSVDREKVHVLFEAFASQHASKIRAKRQHRRLESLVMAVLKKQKLYKVKRYSDGVVVCSFARSDKTFATLQERQTARDILIQQRDVLTADKGGVSVAKEPTIDPSSGSVVPINQTITVAFPIELPAGHPSVNLTKVLIGGSHMKHFRVTTNLPCNMPSLLELSFTARTTAAYRTTIVMTFLNTKTHEQFQILRSILIRAGDADLYDIIQPTSPYVKRKRKKEKPSRDEDIVHPPAGKGASGFKYDDLKHFKVPLDVREMVENREMEESLVPPTADMPDEELVNVYPTFWQNLLWTSELQAYEDIKLFDMENARLRRNGNFMKLYVSGLAEGRPSVLRGDLVICHWKGKQYRGRVSNVELLDLLMEFHKSFHKEFNVSVDRVDLVRFTFTRTAFRTSHAGCLAAPKTMGPRMLAPQAHHVAQIESEQDQMEQRVLPRNFAWASQTLNEEQKKAIKEIAKGGLRPMPYIIFGPPGTG
jgi:hypothetical protein